MSGPEPNVPGSVPSHERGLERVLGTTMASADEIRSRRITLICCLGAVSTLFYGVHDTLRAAYFTGTIQLSGFFLLIVTRYIQVRRKNLTLAGHLLLMTMSVILCVVPLWDGNINSPGLWCAALIPMGAAFIFSEKIVLRYASVILIAIFGHLILSPYFDLSQAITQHAEQWAQMRVMFLVVLSGLGFASAGSSLRTQNFISERTQALEREARAANVAEQSKSAFLAKMSHEIRMPTLGIWDITHRTQTLNFPARFQQKLQAMQTSAARLLGLLDSVLDLAQLEGGNVELLEVELSPSALVQQLHAAYAGKAHHKGISLRTRVCVGPTRYRGDPRHIYQVLAALVDNALKFSDEGEIEIRVQASSAQDKTCSRITFSVHDQGIGMTPEQLSRVFGRFEQVHEEQRGGCGLGLAVANRLSQRMGGILDAKSTPGQGSTFSFSIDLYPASEHRLDQSWTRTVGLDSLGVTLEVKASPSPPEAEIPLAPSMSRRAIRPMVRLTFPLFSILILGNLWAEQFELAGLQFIGLLGSIASQYNTFANSRQRRVSMFLFSLGLAISSQSIFEGNVQSETLWSIGLLPILAAYLLGLRASFIALLLCTGLIGALTYFPFAPFSNNFAFGSGIVNTVALRTSSLIAYAGSSLVIAKGAQQTIASMQAHQDSIRRVNDEAIQSNLDKDRFLRRISDEIGSPMRHIVDLADTMKEHEELDQAQRARLSSIQRGASHLSRLFERTITTAERGSALEEVTGSTFELGQLIHDTCLLFEAQAKRNGLVIQVLNDQPARELSGDPTRILEILAVLLSNAIRFSRQDAIKVTLTLEESQPGHESFAIAVQDKGAGITKDRLDAMIQESEELDHAAMTLGRGVSALARVMAAAKHMGGTLNAQSKAGKGSCFTLRLPMRMAANKPLKKAA